ncbi:MAG: hypothetical protein KatS3mg050_1827 [Litorilinea sp.]|nr:MAG: hypothetical protein KatS3mg050_1827 [Litorilinea sp.]
MESAGKPAVSDWLGGGRHHRHTVGSGRVEAGPTGLRLVRGACPGLVYSNAQLDDYQGLPRRRFPWRPPVSLTVRARFSHSHSELKGTAGFGFWNDPFWMTGRRWPALPQAIWFFFSSPPSNMALAAGVPGHGWKAATIDASRWPFLLLLPTAPLALPLMRWPWLYRRLWPVGQAAMGVCEALVPTAMTDWHTYRIVWEKGRARFWVDETLILACATAPRGPAGLVIWLDNQYMVVTPQGRFAHGLVGCDREQWLEIAAVTVSRGSDSFV